ncbi:MAG TPA: ABC transporter permease [Anaerolineales bacterium]|nr:ABC transporter permease [Anaerolineales bacterium]
MKAWDIALKDITQSFRSMFAVVFMFGIPLLVTGMFYFMLGSGGDDEDGMTIAPTQVQIVNLDTGSPLLAQGMASQDFPGMDAVDLSAAQSMGDVLIAILRSPTFADLVILTIAPDEAAARAAVDAQHAGVAVIIPANFTTALIEPDAQTALSLYQDPALTMGPAIVRALLAQMIENFSGAKITMGVTMEQLNQAGQTVDGAAAQAIAIRYLQSMGDDATGLNLDAHTPGGEDAGNQAFNPIGMIMGGMLIFFAFFTGAATSESILREDERGTLPRLFTTPTRVASILGGKFIAVAITLLGQVIFLLLFGWLIFSIHWGALLPVILAALGLVLLAGTFGVFLVSLLKNSRQGGIVFGGVMTITGMLGIIKMFTMGVTSSNQALDVVSLLVPQGWAMRSLSLAMDGATLGEILPWFGGALLLSAFFFSFGNLHLKQRFA